ncbi:MAG TPA: ABC transporter ATP-binding protein [Bdellovibrionota bacterium]|nr:ABC transporter ATP-binding protein [Bdellovibrionota bacterium]
MPQLLEFESVSKRFPSRELFTDLSWGMAAGERVLLRGANGSGKTTLLKLIATLIRPTSGTIRIHGRSIWTHPLETRKCFAYLSPDERSFYWKLTGTQNLRFFGRLQYLSSKELAERSERLASAFQLDKDLDRPFQEYSSGMRQKLSLIRALMLNRSLYLLDEPDRHLDAEGLAALETILGEKISSGAAVLVVTAAPSTALGGKSYVLADGRIRENHT